MFLKTQINNSLEYHEEDNLFYKIEVSISNSPVTVFIQELYIGDNVIGNYLIYKNLNPENSLFLVKYSIFSEKFSIKK